jgi:hypothetical protein
VSAEFLRYHLENLSSHPSSFGEGFKGLDHGSYTSYRDAIASFDVVNRRFLLALFLWSAFHENHKAMPSRTSLIEGDKQESDQPTVAAMSSRDRLERYHDREDTDAHELHKIEQHTKLLFFSTTTD